MSDFERMCRMITRFPATDQYGDNYKIHTYRNGKCILFATDDSYCWAHLYFDKEGKFIGFSDELE